MTRATEARAARAEVEAQLDPAAHSAHRQRQVAELRRFAVALGDSPDTRLIAARADRLEALAVLLEESQR